MSRHNMRLLMLRRRRYIYIKLIKTSHKTYAFVQPIKAYTAPPHTHERDTHNKYISRHIYMHNVGVMKCLYRVIFPKNTAQIKSTYVWLFV